LPYNSQRFFAYLLHFGEGHDMQFKKSLSTIFSALILSTLLLVAVPAQPAFAATSITVNTSVDELNTDGDCSLREAIETVNTGAQVDNCTDPTIGGAPYTITVPTGSYTLDSGAGQLYISASVTITGNGAGNTIIQASTCNPVTLSGGCTPATWRVLRHNGGTLMISGVTIRHGYCNASCAFGDSGGIYNEVGDLTLDASLISANQANADGGGIYHKSGTLTIKASTVSRNQAESGGGIYTESTLNIQNGSLVSANTADDDGGGIYIEEDITTIDASTVSANTAGFEGGGIFSNGTLNIQNGSLIGGAGAANTAEVGGGIVSQNTMTLDASTVSANTATDSGGGIINSGTLNIQNGSLIGGAGAGNTSGGDAGGIYNDGPMTIDASTVSANQATGTVLDGHGGGIINFDTIIIQNGSLIGGAGAENTAKNGGGIYNDGKLTINASTVSANQATSSTGSGGGIYNLNTITSITNSTINGNQARNGGGIFNRDSGPIIHLIENSTFSGNSAGNGGGIGNWSDITSIANSTFSDNSATAAGGGLLHTASGTITSISNSTFSGNSATNGGGIGNYSVISTIVNSTFSGNSATTGGGINNLVTITNIDNTIVANSPSGGNCNGVPAGTDNLTDSAGCGSWANALNIATLGSLADNGGPTKTHALLAGSIAIDSGGTCTATDQRGANRPVDGGSGSAECDIGAFEYTGNDVALVVSSSDPSDGSTKQNVTEITVTFSKDVLNDTSGDSASETGNYVLAEIGVNGVYDTPSCGVPVTNDDMEIAINSASYNSGTNTTTLGINNGVILPDGIYRLFVCGTTTIHDLIGLPLNGGLSDTQIDFTVQAAPAEAEPTTLPEVGFSMGRTTSLPIQPVTKAYASTEMRLEIPSLAVSIPIVGVPQGGESWDVTWLGNSAGYLAGSAFPTWAGNTVLTGHVWDANNNPGPFSNIKTLQYGDLVQVQAFGMTYTYEVRESRLLFPGSVDTAMEHEEYDWVTLITCEFFNPFSDSYIFRRMVKAVLVDVSS
jgi:LPXTG-site transpeptidase (sortase) family protein